MQSGPSNVYAGLLQWQICYSGYCYTGDPTSPGDICSVASNCVAAGKGLIAAATFAMVFAAISICLLHYFTTFKERFRIPFPRILLLISNFLSLCLYIVVVATWYEKCQNQLTGSGNCISGLSDIQPGYAVATAIVCVVLSFFAWVFSFWRSCRPNRNEPTTTNEEATSRYVHQSSAADLGTSSSSPKPTTKKSSPAAATSGGGYSNGGNSASNDEDEETAGGPGGYGGGGYGGSYGGSYGNSSYGGSSYGGSTAKQQSAYGY